MRRRSRLSGDDGCPVCAYVLSRVGVTTKGTVAGKGTVAKLQERLERAIELSPYGTKTAFHEAFATLAEERGLAGRSNPVFYRHLSGMGKAPNVEWLRVFSETAGVRWEWLASGVGGVVSQQVRGMIGGDEFDRIVHG